MAAPATAARTRTINIRIEEERRSLIDRAASLEKRPGAMNAGGISAPEHLTAEHDVSAFDSGTPELDNWLKRRALANEALGILMS